MDRTGPGPRRPRPMTRPAQRVGIGQTADRRPSDGTDVRLTDFHESGPRHSSRPMPRVTVQFSEEELDAVDRLAATETGGDRDAVVRSLLDEWLERR